MADKKQTRFRLLWTVAGTVVLFSIFFAVQILCGSYRVELSGYPDEPGHLITGMMLDQYFRHLVLFDPLQFARSYYERYPFVAIGHWPPVLYIVTGFWTLIFGVSREAILFLHCLIATSLAVVTWRTVRKVTGELAGFWAGLLTALLPVVQRDATQLMADSLTALFCLLAACALIRYLENFRPLYIWLFAAAAAAAILTKGNGWVLYGMLPAALVLSHSFGVLRKLHFWLSNAAVLAVCLPWQILTKSLVQNGWEQDAPTSQSILVYVYEYTRVSWRTVGILVCALAVIAMIRVAKAALTRREISVFAAVHSGMILATLALNVMAPTGVENRKVMTLVPSVIGLAALTIWRMGSIQKPWVRFGQVGLMAAALVSVFFITGVKPRPSYGFIDAAGHIAAKAPVNSGILVSSGNGGEGMFTAELALRQPDPQLFVIRASKLFSNMSWSGASYELTVKTLADMGRVMDTTPVSWILLDNTQSTVKEPQHVAMVRQFVMSSPKWRLERTFSGNATNAAPLQLYARISGPAPVKGYTISQRHMFGQVWWVKGKK